MNTSKNNFESQIKKQINERELAPSRDLWSEIETQSQTGSNIQTKKINWFLVAACLVLLMSLGAVLVFNENNQPDIQIVEKKTTEKPTITTPKIENSNEIIQENQKKNEQIENIASAKTENIIHKDIDKQTIPIIKENYKEIAVQISQVPVEKIFAKADSAKVQVKKKKYVDPSTLLFSVEHKEIIEKTKGGSNVATIDLNSK